MVPYTNTPADEGGEDDIADAFDEAQRVDKQILRVPLNRYVVSTFDFHVLFNVYGTTVVQMIELMLCVML